jgi:membrane dipeptidase
VDWIDGHLDLAYIAQCGRDLTSDAASDSCSDEFCISLPALRSAGVKVVFATIFTEPGANKAYGYPSSDDIPAAELAGLRQLEIYENLESAGQLEIVRTRADLDNDSDRLKIVILMEGADPIRSPKHLQQWVDRGLRIVGLTWAMSTRYAGGNSKGGPLTPQGRELIAAMDELNIVHDLSHLSDESFDSVMEVAKGRVIASHSNCRALLEPKQRHLRDDQIRAIAERGGIIGLNLYSSFLAVGRRATIADCVAHVQHVTQMMGHRNGVALGSDIDGGFPPSQLPEGLDHPSKLNALATALTDAGWRKQEINGFASNNWRRLMEEVL